MSGRLVYAYGVVGAARRPGVAGTWPRLPGGGRPRLIELGSKRWLVAADVPAADYGAGGLADRIHDLEWVAACGVAHHDTLARLARRLTVVPFRVFTVFESDSRAVAAAARRRRMLDRTFTRVAGCREWVVRAVHDPEADTDSVSNGAGAPGRRSSGTAYLLARAASRRARSRPPRGAITLIRSLSADLGRVARRAIRRRPEPGQGVLLDIALLVPRGREEALHRAVRRWTTRLADRGCRVWQTGPWPPYSFVSGGRANRPADRRG